jgi:hypothetical protein
MAKKMTLWTLALVCLLAVGAWVTVDAETGVVSDDLQIAALVNEMNNIDDARLNTLRPLPVRRYEVPGDSVDVMRARITETYAVDGIGEDTVELTGWVAVKHFDARPIEGATELNWNTLVVDTQFVGMELKGHSDLFGPVVVRLDENRQVQGQVGRIEMPHYAEVALLAELDKSEAEADDAEDRDLELSEPEAALPATCVAPAVASIYMPELDLQMETVSPVYWYSLVDTIPPVGHTASIAVEPVRLSSNGREVGTLVGGKVHFREVVRQVWLNDNSVDQIAAK